jgi:hypothetical protein
MEKTLNFVKNSLKDIVNLEIKYDKTLKLYFFLKYIFIFKCDKAHLTLCPDYIKNKSCSRGSKCPLMHRNCTKLKQKKSVCCPNQVKENEQECVIDDDDDESSQLLYISIKDSNKSIDCKHQLYILTFFM